MNEKKQKKRGKSVEVDKLELAISRTIKRNVRVDVEKIFRDAFGDKIDNFSQSFVRSAETILGSCRRAECMSDIYKDMKIIKEKYYSIMEPLLAEKVINNLMLMKKE